MGEDAHCQRPGEEAYPTQPFPPKSPPFALQGVALDDQNDLTTQMHALAAAEMQRFALGPLVTPPSPQGTLQRPSGGATPSETYSNPMTYTAQSGRQSVVASGRRANAALVAFTLP
ncbi:hypothetical protein [Candidatus Poriferisodalis sp.]|uniref:hypothetical protein n=1 Tax=Candidatus Poriferisodalis sp. TaxID=3101277 RepID=UPI003B021AF9